MRHWSPILILITLLSACGDAESVDAHDPAVEPVTAPTVTVPAKYRARVEQLDLADSAQMSDRKAAWAAYHSLRDGGEDALAAILRLPDADRPLLAMLKAWMRSDARASMKLTPLGDELEFTEEIRERTESVAFRLEVASAGESGSETIEVDGRGQLTVRRSRDGAEGLDSRELHPKELSAFFGTLLGSKFWLQRGIRQAGSEDEALLTLSQLRDGAVVRQIEVWDKEATTFNRSLGKIVAGFRTLLK